MSKITNFRFHWGYFLLALLLFLIEIVIAKYFTGWVRSYLGDVLVIVLIYSALMATIKINKTLAILLTLALAYIIEFSQYFKLAERLGFEQGSVAYIVLGNTFSVEDLVCYLGGGLLILVIERILSKRTASKNNFFKNPFIPSQ